MLRNTLRRFSPRLIPAVRLLSSVRIAHPIIVRQLPGTIRAYSVTTTDGKDIAEAIDDVTIGEYNRVADDYLSGLLDQLEFLSEDYPQIDVELTQGVMTLELPPNGTYVINKQPPNKQIWLSSPISGPKRYDLIGGKWTTLRDNTTLTALIRQELATALEREIDLSELEA